MQQEIDQLKIQVSVLQKSLERLEKSDRYTFEKGLQLLDGRNIQVGRGTGTKIGTATDQKIALYGETPIVQQSAITTPTVSGITGGDTVSESAVSTNFTNLKTAIDSIRTALTNFGITA